jgi:predicted GNAT family acetyltransferase
MAVGCMRRIDPATGEIKRMWVDPAHRGRGIGRAMLEQILGAARERRYPQVRLYSPDFMTAAHAPYRSLGFAEIDPYPETEIPEKLGHEVTLEPPTPSRMSDFQPCSMSVDTIKTTSSICASSLTRTAAERLWGALGNSGCSPNRRETADAGEFNRSFPGPALLALRGGMGELRSATCTG